jgi:hypothetical protein
MAIPNSQIMSESKEKKQGGSKMKSGHMAPYTFRLAAEDVARLEWVARRWRTSSAAVIRKLLADLARQEGMPETDQDN